VSAGCRRCCLRLGPKLPALAVDTLSRNNGSVFKWLALQLVSHPTAPRCSAPAGQRRARSPAVWGAPETAKSAMRCSSVMKQPDGCVRSTRGSQPADGVGGSHPTPSAPTFIVAVVDREVWRNEHFVARAAVKASVNAVGRVSPGSNHCGVGQFPPLVRGRALQTVFSAFNAHLIHR
jgi:hypothetical protein